MEWSEALVPFASVLLGAFITYWTNVRTRRRTRFEDMLHEAMEASALASANHHVLSGGLPLLTNATSSEQREHDVSLAIEQQTDFVRSVRAGRAALARLSVHVPELRPYVDKPDPFGEADTDAIMAVLQTALARGRTKWVPPRLPSA